MVLKYIADKVRKHSKFRNFEYIGKCLLIEEGKEKVLVIGDLHLGFEQGLNEAGTLVRREMFRESMEELGRVFEKSGKVDVIVLLGDLKHAFGKILGQEWKEILNLIDYLKERCKKLVLIKGNHDILLGAITKRAGVKLRAYWNWKRYCFVHGDENIDEIWNPRTECVVMGHGHPAVVLKEGAKREKYKCFLIGRYKGKKIIIVPSFAEWYAGSDVREGEVVMGFDFNFDNFEVRIVGDNLETFDFGKLKDIKQ